MTEIHAVIIDDSEIGLKVLGGMLEISRIAYTAIQDPRHVRATLQTLPRIDVIFLDLEMPHLSGPDVLRLIKQELGLTAPVVAYSVHTSEVDVVRQLGFDGFIGKPVDLRAFPAHLDNILNGRPVWVVG